MPELPEVETTRLGLLPKVKGLRVSNVIVRNRRLRWPIPRDFEKRLTGRVIGDVLRRGKYLLWDCESGFVLNHLGMSGSLRIQQGRESAQAHDHVDIVFSDQLVVRYTDPRRFGAMLWLPGRDLCHPLLDKLGPEPLSDDFNGAYLYSVSRERRTGIKEFIMNGHIVVGVGNIYASESLFLAGIHPRKPAGNISRMRCERLAESIKQTLNKAILAGGSSLRDYVQADGELGYFQSEALVYGRDGLPCSVCGNPLRTIRQGQRSTYFCATCQK
jgi:formamidopyrimidine-DNA glycosylase